MIMNVKSQIVRDKILWKCSLAIARGRLYLPFAQLFDRIPKPNENTTFDVFSLTFGAASAHSALWSNLSWTEKYCFKTLSPISPSLALSHPIDLLFSFLRPPLYCLPTLDRESPFLKLCRRPRVSLPLSLTPMTPTTMTVT